MATRDQTMEELARLVHARNDIRSAASLFSLLALRDFPISSRGIDNDYLKWGLWTGAVVSYGRPFGSSALGIGNRWERFGGDGDLIAIHQKLIKLRHEFFAHSDKGGYREAVHENGEWGEHRVTLNHQHALRFKILCVFQIERLSARIDLLTKEPHTAALLEADGAHG